MKNMKIFILFLVFIFNFSCGNVQRVDTAAVKEKMGDYKIKKVKEVDIVHLVEQEGDEIINQLLQDKVVNINCKLELQKPVIKKFELLNTENIVISDIKNNKLKGLLEAYCYGIKNKEQMSNNIQQISDSTLVFTFLIDERFLSLAKCNKNLGIVYFSKQELVKSL